METHTDLTGRPARAFRASRGKAISWQAFAEMTKPSRSVAEDSTMVEFANYQYCAEGVQPLMAGGNTYVRPAQALVARPIPAGAIRRTRQARPRPEPRPLSQYWSGGECRFARRYTDPTRRWKGWKPARPTEARQRPMLALLRPLSAKATARHCMASVSVPTALLAAPATRRVPLAEEHTSGRIAARHLSVADWFSRDIQSAGAKVDGVRKRNASGAMLPCGSRDPFALWPAEAAADRAIRLRWRFRTLGPLSRIVVRALQGAEMADLAPAWKFPQRHKAEAGRIRLRAALELCARMAEREVDRLPSWEVLDVVHSACNECAKLEATRRIRMPMPANDNNQRQAAA